MKRKPENGIYEKPEDLAVEQDVAAKFSAQVNYTCKKLSNLDHADFRLTTLNKYGIHETVGFLEVRKRNINSTDFRDVMIGQPKYDYLKKLGRKNKVPVFFVFVYNDRSLFFDITTAPKYPIKKAQGRSNCSVARKTDYEPSYYIPVSDLQPFD